MATHADISGNLTMAALQSVRRNVSNTAFEAYTSKSGVDYLVYSALITQSGTSAPVANVLQNTLGFDVSWSRSNVGQYAAALVGSSFPDETFILVASTRTVSGGQMGFMFAAVNTGNGVIDVVSAYIAVIPYASVGQGDDILTDAPIEIRIYQASVYIETGGARAGITVRGVSSVT